MQTRNPLLRWKENEYIELRMSGRLAAAETTGNEEQVEWAWQADWKNTDEQTNNCCLTEHRNNKTIKKPNHKTQKTRKTKLQILTSYADILLAMNLH